MVCLCLDLITFWDGLLVNFASLRVVILIYIG